jgi:hypothetical protein
MLNESLWLSIFGLPPTGVYVIIDSRLSESYGQLRALPLLRRLGIENFTFTSSWRGLDIVPYRYRIINEAVSVQDLVDDFPIVQFISQQTADRSNSEVSRKLLMAEHDHLEQTLLVFVLENQEFMLPGSLGTKSFIDEYELMNIYSYEAIFARFCQQKGYPNPALGSDKSLNLMFHHMAWTIGDQTLLTRLADLFNYSKLPASSWGWDLLEQLTLQRGIRDDDRTIHNLLRPWVDSDISRVSSRLLNTLQQFNFDRDLIQKERARLGKEESFDAKL